MATAMPNPAEINGYHAHIYYDPEKTRDVAAKLRCQIEERFDMVMGRWHDGDVGPHPTSMYQVAFDNKEFSKIVPFLSLNREGLSILIHPETGNAYLDHSTYAIWLGKPIRLRLAFLKRFSG